MVIVDEWSDIRLWYKSITILMVLDFIIFLPIFLIGAADGFSKDTINLHIPIFITGVIFIIALLILTIGAPNRFISNLSSYSTDRLSKNADILKNVIKRSQNIKLSSLASLLSMQEHMLLKWLYSLPDSYNFTIKDDQIDFSGISIENDIDQLIEDFSRMEKLGIGKM